MLTWRVDFVLQVCSQSVLLHCFMVITLGLRPLFRHTSNSNFFGSPILPVWHGDQGWDLPIHVQYCDILRFTVLHNKHHKVSQSVLFFMHCKTVTILLKIKVSGHFVMCITENHESHCVTVLDNPRFVSHVDIILPSEWLDKLHRKRFF